MVSPPFSDVRTWLTLEYIRAQTAYRPEDTGDSGEDVGEDSGGGDSEGEDSGIEGSGIEDIRREDSSREQRREKDNREEGREEEVSSDATDVGNYDMDKTSGASRSDVSLRMMARFVCWLWRFIKQFKAIAIRYVSLLWRLLCSNCLIK